MEPLKDWYRYVDQVSRPARKDDPGSAEQEAAPWRPWKQENGLEPELPPATGESQSGSLLFSTKSSRTVDEEVEIGRIVPPPLFGTLSAGVVHAGTCMPAGRHYEDLTVNDTLQPIPEFTVPRLSAPMLEFDAPCIPSLAPPEPEPTRATAPIEHLEFTAQAPIEPVVSPDFRLPNPGETPTPRERPHAGPAEVSIPPAPAPESSRPTFQPLEALAQSDPARGEEGDRGDKAPRHWDLLTQIRGRDVAQNSYKSQFQETREELVQRLLDPELTLEETARLLDVCPTTVRRYTNKGQLRCFRTPGNQRRFRLSDILEFMENRVAEPGAETGEDPDAGESEPA